MSTMCVGGGGGSSLIGKNVPDIDDSATVLITIQINEIFI